jgi:O-antigen/teichoic acid export membrane protein
VWMMALAAYTIPTAFGLNLFAEAAGAPSELARHSRDALRVAVSLALAATAALALLGPLVLSILGSTYASNGAAPVRIISLAAAPMVFIKVYLAACRATGRMREGTAVAAVAGAAAVSSASAAASGMGLTGVAVAWLAVQLAAAIVTGLRLRALLAQFRPSAQTNGRWPHTEQVTTP